LILGGISGAGMMTFIEDYRPAFMAVTFAFLGGAFYMSYRPRPAGAPRSRLMWFNRAVLWAVTAAVVVMLFFPQLFTSLVQSPDQSTADAFTDDMRLTVIAVEGMT
jgi:hypothetical protein